jgi:hypothetical protein
MRISQKSIHGIQKQGESFHYKKKTSLYGCVIWRIFLFVLGKKDRSGRKKKKNEVITFESP